MNVVMSMNLQWKIILSTCLVIAICFTTASALASATTKSSFDTLATGFPYSKVELPSFDWSSKPGWCLSFPTSLPTPLPEPNVPVAITMSEALEIAASYGVRDNPLCPGIKAARQTVVIDGKKVWVWKVNGRCGTIVYLDMYSGDLVKEEGILCVCLDYKKVT